MDNQCHTKGYFHDFESAWVAKYWAQIFQKKACQKTLGQDEKCNLS